MRSRGWQVLGVGVVSAFAFVAVGTGCSASTHGNPDPGGRILDSLKPVTKVIPATAHIESQEAVEPYWDSCDGRSGSFGWSNVTLDAKFNTDEPANQLLDDADRTLSAAGWTRTSSVRSAIAQSEQWVRTVAGRSLTAALGSASDGKSTYWYLEASGSPDGKKVAC